MSLLKFKALADETRIRLAHILFHYELSVNELVQILDMGQSRVSRHLKILTEAGLLKFRRDGLWVFYSVPPDTSGYVFLQALLPFFPDSSELAADLGHAKCILEERARRTRQFFNAIAEDWDDLNREVLGNFDLAAEVVAAMPDQCATAVDLGCGTGVVLEQMLTKAGQGIGVDGSARMLELCRERISRNVNASGRVSLRIGDLSHLPLADREADFACINLVLHHLPQPGEIFKEISRILSDGGHLFIADFLRHSDESMRKRYGDHWLGFNKEELQGFLERAGFTVLASATRPVGRQLSLLLVVAQAPPR